jgi:DNA repair protein SbcD/Mre11
VSTRPLRFVHTSDLHLEQPPFGIAQVPEHLRELFIECAYWAAERVFAVALSEEVEFLILAGDVLQPQQTGPRGPLFLAEQFERLAERGIEVFWAGGRVDPPEAWPTSVRLPAHVHVFPGGRTERFAVQREGMAVASVVGVSRQQGSTVRLGDFSLSPEGLFTVAVVHGNAEAEALSSRGIDYWALGGDHLRKTLFTNPKTAHYPGSPQGRDPSQVGPRGCTLVEVDADRNVRTTFMPADVMRWHSERVVVDASMARQDLQSRLADRILALRQSNPGTDLLVSWTIVGDGRLVAQLRRGSLAGEMLETLRTEHGFGSPAVWSVTLTAEPLAIAPPRQRDQQTILGDFLSELQRYRADSQEGIGLEAYLPEEHRTGQLATAAVVESAADRERMLREAAMLGVDLLSGEDPEP